MPCTVCYAMHMADDLASEYALQRDLTPVEVADIMGFSPDTIRRWCRTGQFAGSYQVVGGWRITWQAVQELRHGHASLVDG